MKVPIFFLIIAMVICSGCRAHKEVAASEVCVTNDSISSDITSNWGIKTETFDIREFSAEDLQIIFKADSVKVGDSVIYNPQITTMSKNPKVSETSAQKTEEKAEVKSDLKAGSNTSIHKESKQVKEVKRSYPWAFPIIIIGLTGLLLSLLIYLYRRRHR